MTGPEFCKLLSIDYEAVLAKRKEHQADNLRYFVEQLLEIDAVKDNPNDALGFGTVSWDGDEPDTRH